MASSAAPRVKLAALEKASCYGSPQDATTAEVRERVAMLRGMNPALAEIELWQAFLWRLRHHWAVVIRPQEEELPAHDWRVDTDLLRVLPEGEDSSMAHVRVPCDALSLVLELLVPSDTNHRDFFLHFEVYPDFDPQRKQVEDLGVFGPLKLGEIAERAIGVISRYSAYGMIGCNCQHFAHELLKDLGVPAAADLITEDQLAEQAAARGLRGFSLVTGISKGVAGASALAATTGGVVTGAAVGVLSAHIVAGVAVGWVGSVAVRGAYNVVCDLHRRRGSSSTSIETSAPSVETAGGKDDDG